MIFILLSATINTFTKLYDYIEKLKEKKFPLYDDCTLDVDNQQPKYYRITAGNGCKGSINIGDILKTFYENFDVETFSSGNFL